MLINDYDNAAASYELLSHLIFGQSLLHSQTCMIDQICAGDHILIVGGGTGEILEEIAKIHPSGLTITYVEMSAKMMDRAKRKELRSNHVNFITLPIEEFSIKEQFDVVITAYLFDNFSQKRARSIFEKIDGMLRKNGKWLSADFQFTGLFWQTCLLWLMYRFFGLLCKVEAKELPEVNALFINNGYHRQLLGEFYWRFLVSIVYQKGKA